MNATTTQTVEEQVKRWLSEIVIGHGLCPFAKQPFKQNLIRYVTSLETSHEAILEVLHHECERLDNTESLTEAELTNREYIETTLLICPNVSLQFDDYLALLALANDYLAQQGWEGRYQIASFHPQYQFQGTSLSSRENYSNRSPYPILHLLREDSLSKVIAEHPDIDAIPERNIAYLKALSKEEFEKAFTSSKSLASM